MPNNSTQNALSAKRLKAKENSEKILRTVPFEKGFHFYTGQGRFTGETATDLYAFENKLQVVPAESVNYHLQRGDFQKWLQDTIGDDKLAKKISLSKKDLPAEELRKNLVDTVKNHIAELRAAIGGEVPVG